MPSKMGIQLRLSPASDSEYEQLVQFFAEQGLEYDGDEQVDTDVVQCYKLTMRDGSLAGGVCLAMREGKYIIDGIAVDPMLRGRGAGTVLLNKVLSRVKELGGTELYLVARAPEFFRKHGFVTVDPSEAPTFFECSQCSQYMVSCHPEIMKKVIE